MSRGPIGRLLALFFIVAVQNAALASYANAQEMFWANQIAVERIVDGVGVFVAPNERYPGLLAATLAKAPAGVYVSVGTERGFIGGALSPNVTHLILADRDPGVVAFNEFNTLLLRISKDRGHYLRLRLAPTLAQWRSAIRDSDLSLEESRFLLYYFEKWSKFLQERNEEGELVFAEFHQKPKQDTDKFFNANYLYDNNLFERIQKMAKAKAIHIYQTNFLELSDVQKLLNDILYGGLTISVFDISNAWWSEYIPREIMVQLLEQVAALTEDESKLITTGHAKILNPETRRPLLLPQHDPRIQFKYSTFDFGHIRKFRSMARFMEKLPSSFGFTLGIELQASTRHNNIDVTCADYLMNWIKKWKN